MRRTIPAVLLEVVANVTSGSQTHASLDSLFTYAGATGEPPEGSKLVKAMEWLRRTNKDEASDPLGVLGKIIEGYMDGSLDPKNDWYQHDLENRERIAKALAACQLQYLRGGRVVGLLGAPSRTLEQFIREGDTVSIDQEFDRARATVELNPREAVSAASNILESVCKVYIEEEDGLKMPAKQDLKSACTIVRKHLGFDPSLVEDQDLQKVLSGMISVVEGIAALRTHASSAHGAGKRSYKLEPRHARLAVHAAHTVALFTLESWRRKKAC